MQQRLLAEESPVEGYERHRQSYRACVEGCSRQFSSLQASDDGLRRLQSELYEQLVEADTIWDNLKVSREQSGSRKKCAAQMQDAVDALKLNLSEQADLLFSTEKQMAALRASLDDYSQVLDDAALEHKQLSGALDQKVKEMKRDIKAMLPTGGAEDTLIEAAPRGKKGPKDAEGKKQRTRSTSPSRSRSSPKRSR